MVLYGDSFLPIPFRPVVDVSDASDRGGLMTVFRNDGRWDISDVEFGNGVIRCYDKVNRTEAMRHIDHGLNMFRSAAFDAWPSDRPLDPAVVLQDVQAVGRLRGLQVNERFYEAGSPAGIEEIERFITTRSSARPDRT